MNISSSMLCFEKKNTDWWFSVCQFCHQFSTGFMHDTCEILNSIFTWPWHCKVNKPTNFTRFIHSSPSDCFIRLCTAVPLQLSIRLELRVIMVWILHDGSESLQSFDSHLESPHYFSAVLHIHNYTHNKVGEKQSCGIATERDLYGIKTFQGVLLHDVHMITEWWMAHHTLTIYNYI